MEIGTGTAPLEVSSSTQPSTRAETPEVQAARLGHEAAIKNGANWFYWIAALSVINTVAALSGSEWGFALGLSFTSVVDYVARELGAAGMVVAVVVDVLAIGFFVLLGVFANRKQRWAFIVGLVVYGLDTLLTVVGMVWIGIAIHLFAMWAIWTGLRQIKQLEALEQSGGIVVSASTSK